MCVCTCTPEDKVVEEEDLSIYRRRRVLEWAASKMGGLPRPLLGSSERDVMLEDAQSLDRNADVLSKEAELLREQAYQKRVLCAPIRSLPRETLSQIIVLATPESFAFGSNCGSHPLSSVSREWCNVVKTTPEIWSRIHIWDEPMTILRDLERRLPSWLTLAGSTGLKVTLKLYRHSLRTSASQAVWSMLLSIVINWQEFSYRGPSAPLNQFLENAHSAVKLERAILEVTGSQDLDSEIDIIQKPSPCRPKLPRLQILALFGQFPVAFIKDPLLFATHLRTLTLDHIHLSRQCLAGIAASFPFITTLHLKDIHLQYVGTPGMQAVAFERLEQFRLSRRTCGNGGIILLPALQECHALKSLRLQFASFLVAEESHQLPSVERLELDFGGGVGSMPETSRLQSLFAILPSLKFLKVTPTQATYFPEWQSCEIGTILEELLIPGVGDLVGLTLCPQLQEVVFQKAKISNRDLISFIEGRTFNAGLETLNILYEYGEDWWKPDPNRNARYTEWKPTCVVTTSNCFGTPDMVAADLEFLVDGLKSGKLLVHEPV